jgi:hypothetical protein
MLLEQIDKGYNQSQDGIRSVLQNDQRMLSSASRQE